MRFKEFLTEWIYNTPKELESINSSLQKLNTFITNKDFDNAGLELKTLKSKLENQLRIAERMRKTQEINYIIPILNNLHKINKNNSEIRNISTKEY